MKKIKIFLPLLVLIGMVGASLALSVRATEKLNINDLKQITNKQCQEKSGRNIPLIESKLCAENEKAIGYIKEMLNKEICCVPITIQD